MPVLERNGKVCGRKQRWIMAGDDHCATLGMSQSCQCGDHHGARRCVKARRWFVGKNYCRIKHQGPGDGHALLLAARQQRCARSIARNPEIIQQFCRPLSPRFGGGVAEPGGDQHVGKGIELFGQVEILEDEAGMSRRQPSR